MCGQKIEKIEYTPVTDLYPGFSQLILLRTGTTSTKIKQDIILACITFLSRQNKIKYNLSQ